MKVNFIDNLINSFAFFPFWKQTQHHRGGAAEVMIERVTEIIGFHQNPENLDSKSESRCHHFFLLWRECLSILVRIEETIHLEKAENLNKAWSRCSSKISSRITVFNFFRPMIKRLLLIHIESILQKQWWEMSSIKRLLELLESDWIVF